MSTYEIAVVGSGIAGLTAAALLARDGRSVVLLEHHDKPGGCAGYFSVPSRHGEFTFSTGATVALGLESGGLHREIFDLLGAQVSSTKLEKLSLFLPDRRVEIAHDSQTWRRERALLPGNRAGQEAFWRAQELVADAGWFALGRKPSLPIQNWSDIKRNLALVHPKLLPMIGALPWSVGELMRWLRVDRDRAFVALVNLGLLITTQNGAGASPLSNGMAGLDLWRHGAHHPHGGLGTIAQKLWEAFENHGGESRFETGVERLKREEGVWKIETSRGELRARRVIANVPIANLRQLVEHPNGFVDETVRRAGQGWGAVTLYAAIRDEGVPADLGLHAQVLTAYRSATPYFRFGDGDDVFLSLSLPGDERAAPSGWRTLNVSTHVRLSEWNDLTSLQYRERKKRWRQKLLDAARVALPELDEARGFTIVGTPRTWEGYTRRAGGSVGGARLTRQRANLRALPSRLGLPDLHLVGDSTFPGQGTVACALSGFNAWREVNGA